MKKIATVLFLALGLLGFHIYEVFQPVDGVDIFDFALSTQNPVERYQYHRNLKVLIKGHDKEALSYLINADCGGGAGCYDHGKTLVQALVKIGDKNFSDVARNLTVRDKAHLDFLLNAGYEYGGFVKEPDLDVLYQTYPLTFSTIKKV